MAEPLQAQRPAAENPILDDLTALQFDPEAPVLLFTQDPTGLGAQISRRLLGLRLALKCRRQVIFPSAAEPPYGQVFKALNKPSDYYALEAGALPFLSTNADAQSVLKLNFWELYEKKELWREVLEWVPPSLQGRPDAATYFEGCLLEFCELTSAQAKNVNTARQSLGLSDATLGVHFRRGDKAVETPFVPAQTISRAIAEKVAELDIDSIFVASDSPEALNELHFPAGVRVIFDETEKRYNNANHKFLTSHPDLVEQETATAVKNIYLLGSCRAVIGQDNAHFATLASAMICRRTGKNPSLLIPGNQALRESRTQALAHHARIAVRAAAKRLFPWATLRHRGRR